MQMAYQFGYEVISYPKLDLRKDNHMTSWIATSLFFRQITFATKLAVHFGLYDLAKRIQRRENQHNYTSF